MKDYLNHLFGNGMRHYILDENKRAIRCDDMEYWVNWFTNLENRIVKKTFIDSIEISTVFLSFALPSPFNNEDPLLFETIVFYSDNVGRAARYLIWEEAVEGHNNFVAEVIKEKDKSDSSVNNYLSRLFDTTGTDKR